MRLVIPNVQQALELLVAYFDGGFSFSLTEKLRRCTEIESSKFHHAETPIGR